MNPVLLILAILPGLAISYVMFRLDKYEREPFGALVFCFILGAALTMPAVWAERWAFHRAGPQSDYSIMQVLWLSFGAVSLNEELLKFGALRLLVFPQRFFNEPIDGIVYAVLIAMGFATLENLLYADRFGLPTVVLRTFTAVPAHLAFAIVQGYYFGLARFNPKGRTRLLAKGFVLAVLLHGAYDVLILQHWFDWLFVLATIALYLVLYYVSRMVKEHLSNSPFK